MLELVSASQMAANSASLEATRLLQSMDSDGDGQITLKEVNYRLSPFPPPCLTPQFHTQFQAAAVTDPTLKECFRRLFGVMDSEDFGAHKRRRLFKHERFVSRLIQTAAREIKKVLYTACTTKQQHSSTNAAATPPHTNHTRTYNSGACA